MERQLTGRLEGKTAVITAAAQGIGKATALAFAQEGARVWATDINEEALSELDGVNGISTMRCDVTDRASVESLAASTGAPDVLFNCAGFVAMGNILDCSEKDWDFSFELNVKGMFRTLQTYLPLMIENGGGSVINMSSVASHVMGCLRQSGVLGQQGGGCGSDDVCSKRLRVAGYSL